MKLMEIAYPRYSKGQELIVSGNDGFQATTVNAENTVIAGDRKATYSVRNQTNMFKNKDNGADWIIIFDHDDGQFVYFHAGKNLWKAERDPFYGNVVSRGKNFLNSLVHKGEDEGTPTT